VDLAHQGTRWGHPRRLARLRRVAGWAAPLIPGIVLLLADGYGLGRLSLWRDEAYTLDAIQRPLLQIFALAGHIDAVITPYYLLLHAWVAVAGASAAALRLPSVLAMAVAAVVTTVIGRRLASVARLPAPATTGLLAGLLFAAAPQVTRYAQDARPYGLVTMCTAIATWLLLRALADGQWRWWAGYGVAMVAAGLFHVLALLLLAAHGTTVWIAHTRQRAASPAATTPAGPGGGDPADGEAGPQFRVVPSRWLAAAGAVVVVLTPLLVAGYGQRSQISWLTRPRLGAVGYLVVSFGGSRLLAPLVALLVAGGMTAGLVGRRRVPVDMVTVAAPWLALPPLVLFAVSQIHPVLNFRYVVYCLPALALLAAAGVAAVTRLATLGPLGKAAWLPAVVIVVLLVALVLEPQRLVRLPSARPDNLRRVAAIVAAYGRPGDAVLYVPSNRRAYSLAYPAPFRRLRDIALAKSPVAAANLIGTQVPPFILRSRFTTVARVWVIGQRSSRLLRHPVSRLEKAEVALLKPFRLVRRWRTGQEMVSLYRRTQAGRRLHVRDHGGRNGTVMIRGDVPDAQAARPGR
jgi:mannosyltransferase